MQLVLLLIIVLPVVQNRNVTTTSTTCDPLEEFDLGLEKFPNLEDVVPTLTRKTPMDFGNISKALIKDVSIDISKININKFRKKIDAIVDEMGSNQTIFNATRRQAIVWDPDPEVKLDAEQKVVRRKAVDLMLQTLYMARHKIKIMADGKLYSNKDVGFQMAYTYRRITLLYRKMLRIFTYGVYRRYWWAWIGNSIILHGKVVRLNVDFLYLWWLMIRLNGREKDRIERERAEFLQDLAGD